ncbi:antigen WC1.1-like [Cetorhinus maximus]
MRMSLANHIQVRLADGGSRCDGRVELYYNGTWGTVCDDSWDLADARVVCDQLKCGQALNATVSGWFGPGAGPIWLHNLKCTANDSVLWECPAGPRAQSECNHKEDAGVICSEHRAVRLQDGPSPCQGRVEVLYNATWGSVCGDSFGMVGAEVVCKQLSCGSARSVESSVTFGRGIGNIWLDDVNCRLHDSVLWQCPSSPWGEHNCDHREDVGVICSGHRQYTAPFKLQTLSVFMIPCIFVTLFVAVSIAFAAELRRSSQKGNRNRQYFNAGLTDPVYEEVDIQEIGTGPDFHSNSSLDKLEYCTGSDLHECEDVNMQGSFSSCDAESRREYDDVQSFEME